MQTSTEEYFQFLHALSGSENPLRGKAELPLALFSLADNGNAYAAFEVEKECLQQMNEEELFRRISGENAETPAAHPNANLEILYLDALLLRNAAQSDIFRKLFTSMIESDDVRHRLLLYRYILAPRFDIADHPPQSKQEEYSRKQYAGENVAQNMSLMLGYLNESGCRKHALIGLLALRAQQVPNPDQPMGKTSANKAWLVEKEMNALDKFLSGANYGDTLATFCISQIVTKFLSREQLHDAQPLSGLHEKLQAARDVLSRRAIDHSVRSEWNLLDQVWKMLVR